MVLFPPCKINLGLKITSKRPDGYHEIETCFYPVPWTDILEIIPSDNLAFTFSGLPIAGKAEDNLCLKAYFLVRKDFKFPPVQLHLHKIIPTGAGLGGGSSDAACMLKGLNEIFSLGISVERLQIYAGQLGSDCVFFVDPKPMLGSGRGEILTPIDVGLRGKFLFLVKPDIHVSTAEAYRDVRPQKASIGLAEILKRPLEEWKNRLTNDFEAPVFSTHTTLAMIKKKLYELGAVYAAMSGSGSSVYGLFEKGNDLKPYFPGMQCWSGELTQ
jgi:4-diphosphocytidyl-2-C-methyl-D-erythritol kinase